MFNQSGSYGFFYTSKDHKKLPHIVKFSGGLSSGMLLFSLLESDMLDASRGDAIVFNNTSAEHRSTYEFTAACKKVVEEEYGIPFFWIESQTYEDARNGEWVRCPTYRLVNSTPASKDNPNGYSWKGEVFEELISLQGFVPNQFRRICTSGLKLNPTRAFLKEWLSGNEQIARRGHYGDGSRIELDRLYDIHRRKRGSVPRKIFEAKKKFVLSRPHFRDEQCYKDYSIAYQQFENEMTAKHCYGDEVTFGSDGSGAEFVAFIGLRFDESHRVIRVWNRSEEKTKNPDHQGENVYMPLHKMFITRDDVDEFWKKQKKGKFELPKRGLSNCTYCFLKGAQVLKDTHAKLSEENAKMNKGTPHDIKWWVDIEKRYSRDLKAEQRKIRTETGVRRIGFFGLKSGFSYKILADGKGAGKDISAFNDTVLPCDCTE